MLKTQSYQISEVTPTQEQPPAKVDTDTTMELGLIPSTTESQPTAPALSEKVQKSIASRFHQPGLSRYSQFLTCAFPRKIHQSMEGTHRKFEVELQYLDLEGQKRKRRVRFGDVGVADMRDVETGIKRRPAYLKKVAAIKSKYKQYDIQAADFDVVRCQKEAWPLKRGFWEANYCWGERKANGQEGEMLLPMSLEKIVSFLQELQPFKKS